MVNLVGGVAAGVGQIADPYFYTQQEQARDKLAGDTLAAQQAANSNALAAYQMSQETTQKAITAGVALVGGLGLLYLGVKLMDGK